MKIQLEHKEKDLRRVWRKYCGGPNASRWFSEFRAGAFSVDGAMATRLVGVSGNKIKTLIENNQCYSTGEIADILKISKSMKLLVKMQSVSFTLWKKLNELLANSIF